MKDKIKEKLLKEILQKLGLEDKDFYPNRKYNGFQIRIMLKKAIEIISKAKDEEFKEILNGWYNSLNTSLDCLTKTIHDKDFEKLKREIKQRRQEK
jgi:hypothetical protein